MPRVLAQGACHKIKGIDVTTQENANGAKAKKASKKPEPWKPRYKFVPVLQDISKKQTVKVKLGKTLTELTKEGEQVVRRAKHVDITQHGYVAESEWEENELYKMCMSTDGPSAKIDVYENRITAPDLKNAQNENIQLRKELEEKDRMLEEYRKQMAEK